MNICSICLDEIGEERTMIIGCGHCFCKGCIDSLFDSGISTCPLCRGHIEYFDYKGEIIRLLMKQVPSNFDSGDQEETRQSIYIKCERLILLQWFIMILLMYFIFETMSIFHEKHSEFTNLLQDSRSDNIQLNSSLNQCEQQDDVRMYIYVKKPSIVGFNYKYCNFPLYYINQCFESN